MAPASVISTSPAWYKKFWRAALEVLTACRDEWLAWVAIAFLALAFTTTVLGCMQQLLPLQSLISPSSAEMDVLRTAIGLNFIGTTWVLAGTLWALLGVYVAPAQLRRLQSMKEEGFVSPSEVVRTFRVASNFGKSGSVFIIIGTLMLMYGLLTQR